MINVLPVCVDAIFGAGVSSSSSVIVMDVCAPVQEEEIAKQLLGFYG